MLPLPAEALRNARPHSLIITVYNRKTLRGYEQLYDITKEEITTVYNWPDIPSFIKHIEKNEYGKGYYIGSYRFLLDLNRDEL